MPSERAFSALRLQHFRLRTRLTLIKIDLLTFIYVNRRILDRDTVEYKKNIEQLTEEEELQLEDEMLNLGTAGGSIQSEEDHTRTTETGNNQGRPTKRQRHLRNNDNYEEDNL